jgi:hypothetical protein
MVIASAVMTMATVMAGEVGLVTAMTLVTGHVERRAMPGSAGKSSWRLVHAAAPGEVMSRRPMPCGAIGDRPQGSVAAPIGLGSTAPLATIPLVARWLASGGLAPRTVVDRLGDARPSRALAVGGAALGFGCPRFGSRRTIVADRCRQGSIRRTPLAGSAVGPIAARLRSRDLTLEGFAAEGFEFIFLLVVQHTSCFFVQAFARSADLWLRGLTIAPLRELAHFTLRRSLHFAELILLVRGQPQRLGHRRIVERGGAPLLQRDLLEPLELVFLQDASHGRVVGLGPFLHFLLPFFAAKIAQLGERAALLAGQLGDVLDLHVRKLELLLN